MSSSLSKAATTKNKVVVKKVTRKTPDKKTSPKAPSPKEKKALKVEYDKAIDLLDRETVKDVLLAPVIVKEEPKSITTPRTRPSISELFKSKK